MSEMSEREKFILDLQGVSSADARESVPRTLLRCCCFLSTGMTVCSRVLTLRRRDATHDAVACGAHEPRRATSAESVSCLAQDGECRAQSCVCPGNGKRRTSVQTAMNRV